MDAAEARRARRRKKILEGSGDRMKRILGQQQEPQDDQQGAQGWPQLEEDPAPAPPAPELVAQVKPEEAPTSSPPKCNFTPARTAEEQESPVEEEKLQTSPADPLARYWESSSAKTTETPAADRTEVSPVSWSRWDPLLWLLLGAATAFLPLPAGVSVLCAVFLPCWCTRWIYRTYSSSSSSANAAADGAERQQSWVALGLKLSGFRPETVDRLPQGWEVASDLSERLFLFLFSFFLSHALARDLTMLMDQ